MEEKRSCAEPQEAGIPADGNHLNKFACPPRQSGETKADDYENKISMSSSRAVIFDMDGVLVNSEPLHERAFYQVVAELGYAKTHGLKFSDYVGRSDFELWQDFVAKNNPPHSLEELLQRKRERVIKVILENEPIFPGLLPLLEQLAPHFKLGLASGSERAVVQTVLSLKNLRRFFPVVVTAADVKKGKPAPDIFLLAAKMLGAAPQECAVIEDSKPGVTAGLAAGMQVIAITNTHPAHELQHAHHVVKSYDAIGQILCPA